MTADRGRPYPPEAEAVLRQQAKGELRRRLLAVRRALPPEVRARRSAAVAAHLEALEVVRSARVLLGFWPMRGEVDLRPLLEARARAGTTVALPRWAWADARLTLHRHDPDAPLEESGMGFLQPAEGQPAVPPDAVDVALVPAVAADPRGHRIGWGKGFYDRLLPTLQGATTVAVLFDFQLVAEVPDVEGDVAVDHVVSDRGLVAADDLVAAPDEG